MAADPQVQEGRAWVVVIREHPNYDGSPGKDLYQVATAEPAIVASRALSIESRASLRRSLANGKFTLGIEPIGQLLLKIPGSDDEWIGPLAFTVLERKEAIRVVRSELPDGFVTRVRLQPDEVQRITVDSSVYQIVSPSALPLNYEGYFNTQSDHDLVRSLLRRLRKLDRRAWEALSITEKVLEDYVGALEAASLLGEDRAHESARHEAAELLLADVKNQAEFEDEVIQALLGQDKVRKRLDKALAKEIETLREGLMDQFKSELIEHQSKIGVLRNEHEELEASIVEARKDLEQSMNELIGNAVTKLSQNLAVHALLRAGRSAAPPRSMIPKITSNRDLETAENIKDLALRVQKRGIAAGFDPLISKSVLAGLVGARLVILGGASAEKLATIIADTFAGRICVRVAVTPTMFGIGDLLLATATPIGFEVDPPFRLADFIEWSGAAETPGLMILSGSNRTPPENILPELLAAVTTPALGNRFTIIDPDGGARLVAIPENLYILATLSDGDGVFSVPSQISGSVPFMFADFRLTAARPITGQLHDVSCTIDFENLKDAVVEQDLAADTTIDGPVGNTLSRAPAVLNVGALCSAYSVIFGSEKVGQVLAAISLVLGRQSRDQTAKLTEGLEEAVKTQLLSLIDAAHAGRCERFFKGDEGQ